jgi:cell division protein FtsI (penicillin-binding protein 3)
MSNVEETKRYILMRIYLVYAVMLLISIVILAKIIRIQFVEAGELLPSEQDSSNVRYRTIQANRGSIYSADGKLMATSVPVFDIRMDLGNTEISDQEFMEKLDSLASGLHYLFMDRSTEEYKHLLREGRRQKNRYLLIKRKVSYEELTVIRKLPILRKGKFKGGLIAEPRDVREMPYQMLAYRTIGWDKDGTDLDVGLEGAYSEVLSGRDGIQLVKRLPNGIWRPVTTEYMLDPQHGMDVHTTIDMYIQDVAENALLRQLQASNAHHGCVIVMEVATGHIKAIANLQRNPGDSSYSELYNHAIGESYEPGSTFKLASMVAALEDGLVNLDDTVDIGNGVYHYAGYEMKDASTYTQGKISVGRAFEISSNVGISKMIVKAYNQKPAKFSERLQKMRFGTRLGLDISGEGRSMVKTPDDPSWSKITLPWMAIGYEVRVTPLQLLTFYNAVANGGTMVKPMFVTHISNTGETVKQFNTEVLQERIASQKTISQVHELLVRVVDHGTATNIRSSVYKIAGKTGTAKIASGSGGYGAGDYTASFAGYFPADNPKYSCIVVINKPVGLYYGGHIAAPVFKTIADRIYASYLDINHEAAFAFRTFTFPDAGAGMMQEKHMLLRQLGINVADSSYNNIWVQATPVTEAVMITPRPVVVGIMPDLRGMHIKDALYLLEREGVRVTIQGKGRVAGQSLPAGSTLQKGSIITIRLEP